MACPSCCNQSATSRSACHDRMDFNRSRRRLQTDRSAAEIHPASGSANGTTGCGDRFIYSIPARTDFFSARPDKEWSLTDCISFVVMNERGMTDALTSDHHFEQAGFQILLKD